MTEIVSLTGIPDNDDEDDKDVIDVDTFIIDFLIVEVIKRDPDAVTVPPSGTITYELPQQPLNKKKVKADPDA